ncbi:GNAT family N-acetyltransferase [Nocardioides sp. TRM66260-LWL]|uniref:GNAT family N-acetyltransferase n=1 Tax=Nocardioides sp. TRM66260-LWL TaxID=2874478 RepID=UPI001CC4A7EE|nr:GNAT family N-acetyltransferase [Nocardioides sp. TRM66260-LWL]MBZ5734240.1 GNAT family N-acetyltransferase [Nocardioides sp. TRM66260-LWL]
MSASSDVRIRLARPSDLRHLAAIEASGGPQYEALLGPAPALTGAPPTGAQRDDAGTLLVAAAAGGEQAGGEPVGFAHLLVLDGHAHLEQLSVLPEHQGRGIGRALVAAVREEARWAGFRELTLLTYRDVPWNAPLYARLGFEPLDDARLAEPWLAALRAAEQAHGLDAHGVRVAMGVRL